MSTFDVRFQPPLALSDGKQNTLGLIGSGTLEVTPEAVVVKGRRHRTLWFSKQVEITFPRAEVVNVEQAQKAVSLHSGPHRLQVWLGTVEQAASLAQALPTEKTPEFAKDHEERRVFTEQLSATGSGSPVTTALVGLNVVIFGALATQGAGMFVPDTEVMTRWGTNFGPLTMGGEWWRLVTATFLHFGLVHLLMNMWALWSGGQLVERLYGSRQFLVVYAFAGLAGGLASLLWNPIVNSAGASGAIFGVYGAMLAFFTHEKLGVPASVVRGQRTSAITFIAYSLFYGMAHQGVDNAAHVGGLAGGFVMGWLLASPLEKREAARPRWAQAAAVGAPILVILVSLLLRPNPEVKGEQQFLLDLDWVGQQEQRTNEAHNAILEGANKNALTDAEFAERLDSEVIPLWLEIEQRAEGWRVRENSPLANHHRFLTTYVRLRGEGLRLLRDGLKNGDQALVQRATAKFEEQQQLLKGR